MLRNTSELAEDAVSESPIISKVSLEKILEFLPRHRILGPGAMPLLVPLLDHRPAEKRGGKRDSIWPIGPGGFEMVDDEMSEKATMQIGR